MEVCQNKHAALAIQPRVWLCDVISISRSAGISQCSASQIMCQAVRYAGSCSFGQYTPDMLFVRMECNPPAKRTASGRCTLDYT